MSISVQKKPLGLLIISVLLSLLAGCEKTNEYVPPPPPAVTVAQPLQQEVIDYLEFTGTMAAVKSVDVRARVKGFLESMHFEPGTYVEENDLLFVIDPKPFEARLAAAKADLANAQAQLAEAESDYRRKEQAGKKGAVTEADVVAARAQRDAAEAGVAAAKAAVTEAELNLGYTQVTAPISGRVSRNFIDVGNLVGESEATLLTSIAQYDPIYVYFSLNERDLLRAMEVIRKQRQEEGQADDPSSRPAGLDIPLYLGLANEEGYPHEGRFDFADLGVDPNTGTMQLRGVFPNPGSPPLLLPGLFARIRMPLESRENAVLVTERAIGADQGGEYLLVVNSENVVEKRPVRTDQLVDGLRVITEGVRPGEWVIVNGVQRARPGAPVMPERTDMAALTTSALGAAADQEQQAAAENGEPPDAADLAQKP